MTNAGALWLVVLFLYVVATIIVYQDAKRNSPQSAVLWALLVFFAGPVIGGLLYVLLGRDTGSSRQTRRRGGKPRREQSDDEPMNVDDSGPF